MMEDYVKTTEFAIRNFDLSPAQIATLKESLAKVRKLLEETKERRQRLIDEETREVKARPVPTPVAPMPREKRHD